MRNKLKGLRAERNLTQSEMADACGISRQQYAAVEIGKREGSIETWNKIQTVLDIDGSDMWEVMQDAETPKKRANGVGQTA